MSRRTGSRGRVTIALVALLALVLIGWGVKSCSASPPGGVHDAAVVSMW